MKHLLIALIAIWTVCTSTTAQPSTSLAGDSISTAVTVLSTDTNDNDSTSTAANSHNNSQQQGVSVMFDSTDDTFPFGIMASALGGSILITVIAIVSIFGLPIFILFLIFFFRHKNQKARYRIAEQALAAGQPLPEGFFKTDSAADQCAQGIRNIFTGIGLFIFLWAITDEFSIGAIGLLIMFMGIGQWLTGHQREKKNGPKSDASR